MMKRYFDASSEAKAYLHGSIDRCPHILIRQLIEENDALRECVAEKDWEVAEVRSVIDNMS